MILLPFLNINKNTILIRGNKGYQLESFNYTNLNQKLFSSLHYPSLKFDIKNSYQKKID